MPIDTEIFVNDWGFECDRNGVVLNTRFNHNLEMQLREEEEENERRRNGGGSQQRLIRRNTGGRRNEYDDRYDYEEEYDDNIQRVYSGRSSNRQQESNVSRRNASDMNQKRVARPASRNLSLEDEEPIARNSKQSRGSINYDEPVEKKQTRQAPVNKEIKHFEYTKPVDNNYHDVLLPKGFKQKKIYLEAKELDNDKYVVYYKREIYEEGGDNMDGNGLNLGESMFEKTNFAPLSLDVGALVSLNKDDEAVLIERGTDMIDQLLVLINSSNKERKADEIYYADAYVISRYFNNTAKNLFLELVTSDAFRMANLKDIMLKLESIYTRYSTNKSTLNGISKIDKELTESFNAYVAAYSATPRYNCKSILKFASPFLKEVSTNTVDIVDSELRRNLINGMSAFFFTFVAGIHEFVKDGIEYRDDELICPVRDLIVISENLDISKELTEVENKDIGKNVFYSIDRLHTPYMHDMLSRLDKEKTIQKYNRVVFYNYKNIYTIIKCEEGKFTLSNFEQRN